MKNFKFLLPMLAFVMAVGLAFANPTETQSNGWVEIDGVATQLSNDPCNGTGHICKVIFEDDNERRPFTVFTDQTLLTPKQSGSSDAYILPEMPE